MEQQPPQTLKVLWTTFKGYKRHLIVLAVLGVLSAAFEGIGVNAVIPLFSFLISADGALPTDIISQSLQSLFAFLGVPFSLRFLLVFVTILLLFRAVALAIFAYIRARITASFMYQEMSYLLSGTMNAQWPFLVKQNAGYLQNTLFWDVKQSMSLLDAVVQLIQSSTGFVIYLLVALSISPEITLVTSIVGVVLLFILRPLVRRTTILGEEKSGLEKSFSNHLTEHISGLKTVKASGVAEGVIEKGRLLLDRLRIVYTKAAVMHSLGTAFIQPFSFIFILVLFAFAYTRPGFSIAAFIAVLYLIQKIFVYLQSTQSSLHSIADMVPFAANILRFKFFLSEHREAAKKDGQSFIFNKELSFDNVSLSYRPTTFVLSGVSFSVPKGSMIGVIGPSGGGKTSIVDLLLRLFVPNAGRILIDGISVNDIQLRDWQKYVGYVSQDIFLMNASVRDNIRFYDHTISDQEIEAVAKQAHVYDVITRLEKGFDTIVGDRGVTLSGGQRQRVVFARALARKPKILILDEATSALDSESEMAIKDTIDDIKGSVTLLVVAHRISTVMNADELVVLKDGKIVEHGSPKVLAENKESYLSRMIHLQGAGQHSV